MRRKIKVLFVQPYKSTFIQRDLEILQKNFDVCHLEYNLYKSNWKTKLSLILKVFQTDVTFSWFADRHAYWTVKIARLLKKKSIVVLGGYELANIPEISYGLLLNPNSARRVKYILWNADIVLTVDDSLKDEAIKSLQVSGKNIETLPTGYDYDFFTPKGNKKDIVITVCAGDTWTRVMIKRLDIFIESARLLPEINFKIIGLHGEGMQKLKKIAQKNVDFIGPSTLDDLLIYYQTAKIYCQLSMREGLPNSLCEAMLCECIPIGTKIGGIPTAMGNTGFYVPYEDAVATAEAIKKALNSPKGVDARERIKSNFTPARRERGLVKIITGILN